jgi:glycosyltransferase involved in cell wall biosynthesis
LGQRIRQLDPKVILIAGYRPNFYLRALWFAQRQRIPVLLRAETTDHTPVRGRLKQVLRDRFLRSIYRSCSRLLAVGARSLEHYRRLGCPEYKIVFSPYCVDTSPFATGEDSQRMLRPTTRAQLGVNPSDIVVLFSGKLCDRKRPDLLVKAVRTLPGDLRLRVSIVCLGDGPDRLRLEQEAAREPAVRLFVVGFKNQSELSPYYHAADLLCLPSQAETWGLVVNEALHHGLSCVVSHAVGSWPDLIKPGVTGEVFRAGSISGLAEALQRNFVYAGADATREHCLAAVAHYGVQQAAAGIAQACRDVTGTRQLMADPLDAPVATGARR